MLTTDQRLLLLLTAWLCAYAVASRASDLVEVDLRPVPESPFVNVARNAAPSVVSIRVERGVTRGGQDQGPMAELYRQYFPDDGSGEQNPFDQLGSGTGFLVSRSGHILTNNHVIDRADEVRVRFPGEDQDRLAVIVGVDPASDLALLQVENVTVASPLIFADSGAVVVGDWAIAVGNPFGNLAGSLTVGVVSAKGRSGLAIHGGAPRFQNFLQTDAAINFGNSGGPLLDISGRVIGVNTAINSAGQGIGFAIPSNYARRVLEQLAEHGRVIRGWIGARFVDERVDGLPSGVRIEAILDDSPASKAGLAEGDVIVAFADQNVADSQDLEFLVSDAKIGMPQPCRILRREQGIELEVTPAVEPDMLEREWNRGPSWLGMSVASANGDDPRVARLREVFGVETDRGVMVLEVDDGGPAAAAGVQPGDVVLAIEDRPVENLEDYLSIRGDFGDDQTTVTLLIESGGEKSYLRLETKLESREG